MLKLEAANNNAMHVLSSYASPRHGFDELRDETGRLRPQWERIFKAFEESGPVDLAERWHFANRLLQENGTNITGADQGAQELRPWELDLLPLAFSEAHWNEIGAGIAQRARVIEAVAHDLYGPRKLIKQGIIPPEVLFAHPEFDRVFFDLPHKSSPLILYGCELGRSPSGKWWILADRSSAPAGLSYAVENRVVISNALPQVLHRSQIKRLAPFFIQLQETLKRYASRRKTNPSIAVLSAGPESDYYFEDVFLARYLGYPLVEADDLTVRKNRVCVKTLEGLSGVDVLLRRTADQNLDPLEVSGFSPNGIAGLLQSLRNKKVVLANGLTYGLLDAPVIMPFLRASCRFLLEEELKLPSIATWWCGQTDALEYVLANFEGLVIKPAYTHSGGKEYIVSELSDQQKDQLRTRINKAPGEFVAQEKILRSTSPCWANDQLQPGHLAIRTFAVKSGQGFEVMNGGLVRVQTSTAPMALSITAGEFSKDLWICSETPVKRVSLLSRFRQSPSIKRTINQLPSRAADNLFWLGSYLERLEFAGRQIRKVTERLLYESAGQTIEDVLPLIDSLSRQGIIEESYAIEGFVPERAELESIWPKLVCETGNMRGFRGLTDNVYRLASLVRDRMSDDFWRAISQIQREQQTRLVSSNTSLSQLLVELNQQILNTSATTGQILDGLVHGPTRLFLMMGRHLERARQLTILLDQYLRRYDEEDVISLVTLLEVCNSVMTYRSRYRSNFAVLPAIDLLVTDASNPRSLLFQFRKLWEQLSALPNKHHRPQFSPQHDVVRRVLFELESILPPASEQATWESYQTALVALLENMENYIKEIVDQLTKSYFVHVGYALQNRGRIAKSPSRRNTGFP